MTVDAEGPAYELPLDVVGDGPLRIEFERWLNANADLLEEFRAPAPSIAEEVAKLGRFQRLLYDAGWVRKGWPTEFGGLGGTALDRGVFAETLTATGFPLPFSFSIIEVLGPAVLHFAGPTLGREFFPRLLRGDDIWCQGFSEPESGSDLASLRTTAVTDADGYVVTGQKIWTSFAQLADKCMLLVRTGPPESGHRGITALLMDMDTPGVEVRPIRSATGDTEYSEIFLDHVHIPSTRVIGEVDGGWLVALYVLGCERGVMGWQRATWLLHRFTHLLRDAGDALDAQSAGRVYASLYGFRLRARDTLRRVADGEIPGAGSSIDKLLMSSSEQALFDLALTVLRPDILLGQGERDERWRSDYLFSRAASIYGGASEIQKNVIAERLLGLPRGS
jgi:alkylation response protein AidB-like acyl-CoA dehydrogenase